MTVSAVRLQQLLRTTARSDWPPSAILVLVTWSLTVRYFSSVHTGWRIADDGPLAALAVLMLVVSVLVHELAPGLVSRACGISGRKTTAFVFDGAICQGHQPRRPREELASALAGLTTSFGLATVFAGLWWLTREVSDPLHALSAWLAWANLLLVLVNLFPGPALDGGRLLRAATWAATGDPYAAARLVGGTGRLAAFGLMLSGSWLIFGENWVTGLEMTLAGWLLRCTGTVSAERVAEELLAGHTVREVMARDPPRVPCGITLDVFVEQIVVPSRHRCYPVVQDGRVEGLISVGCVAQIPRSRWTTTRVDETMIAASELPTISPADDLAVVFERMVEEGVDQFPVVADGRFLGIVVREGLRGFMRIEAVRRQVA